MSARPRRPPAPVAAQESAAFYEALQELLRIYQFRDRDSTCYGDVTPNECHALEAVERAGGLRVNDLAAALGLHKSNASRIAEGLRRRGLLARRAEKADGRAVQLVATARGRAVHAAIRERVCAAHAVILAAHPAPVRRAFVELLGALAAEAAGRIGGGCSAARREES
jgi:DNA-binding MarR family transcriptional regulator